MSEPRKAYVVTSGEYSDYHILGVYTDENLARKFMQLTVATASRYERDSIGIEEYELDAPVPDGLWMKVTLELGTGDEYSASTVDKPCEDYIQPASTYHKEAFTTCVYTDSRERAVKVANERRAQYLATRPYKQDK